MSPRVAGRSAILIAVVTCALGLGLWLSRAAEAHAPARTGAVPAPTAVSSLGFGLVANPAAPSTHARPLRAKTRKTKRSTKGKQKGKGKGKGKHNKQKSGPTKHVKKPQGQQHRQNPPPAAPGSPASPLPAVGTTPPVGPSPTAPAGPSGTPPVGPSSPSPVGPSATPPAAPASTPPNLAAPLTPGPVPSPWSDPTVSVGSLPTGVAVSNTRAYVDNAESDSLSVIDLTQSPPAVIATVPVGDFPEGVALSPDGTEAYVTNFNSGTLSIVSTASNTVVDTVTVGKDPNGVVRIGGTIYVANLLSATVSMISASTRTVTGTITLPNNGAPSGMSASADGTRLYVDDARRGRTYAFDLTQTPPASLGSVAVGPYAAYLSTPTNPGVVAVPGANEVSLLDLSVSPPTVEGDVAVGTEPYGVVDVPALNEALATNSGDGTVSVIDTFADPPVAVGTVDVGTTPDAIAVTPDDSTAVVANEGSDNVSILHLNQPPTITLPATQSVPANDTASAHNHLVLSSANGNAISAADSDGGSNSEQTTLTALDGTVTLSSTSGLTITAGANGSSTVTVTGPLADLNTDLANGLTYEPATGFEGNDSLVVSVDDLGNTGLGKAETTTQTLTIEVTHVPPTAGAVSFSGAVGNTTFGVGTSPVAPATSISGPTATVLANSSDTNGAAIHAVSGTITTAHGGSVAMNTDGTFTYTPPAGFTGKDTFTFQVSDGTATSSATATITVSNLVWYVNDTGVANGNGVNGNGTSASPFDALSALPAVQTSGDDIFLFGTTTPYGGGLSLKTNETLIGQSFGLSVGGQTLLPASGTNPTVTNAAGAGLTLQSGDAVDGITVSGSSGANVTGSGSFTLDSSDTIKNGLGDGLDVTAGSGTVADGATISGNAGHSVSVQGLTGGTVTIGGPVTDDGGGVLLQNNEAGSEVDFTGGLTASTGANPAFTATGSATGSGTVTVTGSANTLATTTGIALDVANVTIGGNGLTFQSVSAGTPTSGPTQGIILDNTGSGGLNVTGTGTTAGSGGTIQQTTWAPPVTSAPAGGVELMDTGAVSLNDIDLTGNAGGGVWASDAASLDVSNSAFSANGRDGLRVGASGSFSGTFDINANSFQQSSTQPNRGDDEIAVILGAPSAGSGTVTGHITGNTIGANGVTDSGAEAGGNGIDLNDEGAYTLKAGVSDNTISQIKLGNGVNAQAGPTGSVVDLTLSGNNVDMVSTASIDAIAVQSGSDGSTVCLNATGNTATAAGTALVNQQFDADGLTVAQGAATSVFQIQGYTGTAASLPAVQSFLTGQNTLTGAGPTGIGAGAFINDGGPGFTGATSCPTAP